MTAKVPDPAGKHFEGGEVTHAARQPVTSLYIHVPFCRSKCYYCDFYSVADPSGIQTERWRRGVHRELERLAEEAPLHGVRTGPLQTIYFGGGTPSAIPPQLIGELIERAQSLFALDTPCDITLEANPETFKSKQGVKSLGELIAMGVNRISFGLQSFSDQLLAAIGRRHRAKDGIAAIKAAAEAGFQQVALDLMTGLPGQTLQDIDETLKLAVSLPVSHVSCYALTIAEGTPFHSLYRSSPAMFPDDELERGMTRRVIASLRSHGFEHYEISNFAKPGARSRHNLTYWQAGPYLAVGPSAASYMGGIRRCNPSSLEDWLDQVEDAGEGPFGEISIQEKVHEASARVETMILGLRLLEGVTRSRFMERHGLDYDQVFGDRLRSLEARGLLSCEESRVRLTEKGLDFADLVSRELL